MTDAPPPPDGDVRRATALDAAALTAFAPAIPRPTDSETRAVFVVDGADGFRAATELVQHADHLAIEHLVVAPGAEAAGRALIAFAETAGRALGAREVRLRPGIVPDGLAHALGYRNGVKRRRGAAAEYLEGIGVPLWRHGTAPHSQTVYYRGVWAALALIVGMGSISAAVFSGSELTWVHVFLPAALAFAATAFASWQILLIALSGMRSGQRWVAAATCGGAAVAVLLIGLLIQDRAAPALVELWTIYSGDEELNRLAISVGADGTTLHVDGPYGLGSETAVREALDRTPRLRTVVLSGPGGRMGVGYAINRMIRQRKLATRVDAGCASACTIAFLGGVDRSLSAGARLGFHQTSFPGMDENDMYESNRGMRQFLIRNGVTPEFAKRALETSPGSLWVPTPQELLAGRVIHRVNP